ncbi:MAG TPA: inosine/xanthosine triphosphatase [Candidatus Bathyarchaeia archaeon]|nr:inosine/xanthosine triphosphatase [Candidatus Bathyarchaeia archaeon]
MKVAVGSLNPVKIKAAKMAFIKVFGDCRVIGVSVSSGVSDTPLTIEEAIRGAKNRARRAIRKTEADFGVGLEGTFEPTSLGNFLCGFVAIVDNKNRWGFAKGSGFLMPEKIVNEVKTGKELGCIMDKITGIKKIKQHQGATGYFTKNLISRTQSFEQTLIYALSRFIRSEMYESD